MDKLISQLTLATPEETDVIPFVDISDTTMGLNGTTKKATKADLKGAKGETGNGIESIVKTSTVGLTDTYTITFTDSTTTTFDIVNGEDGTDGIDGDDAYVYIAYASDDTGTGFTTTFNATLDYIAIKTTTTPIVSPQASDFTGLWKNYKGAQGIQGIQGIPGIAGNDGLDVTWLGEYNAGTTYVVNDAVSYNGSSYICKLESTGNLPTNTTYFDLMAQKGTDGAGLGDVIAPSTNTDSYIPQWDGANSKTLKNGIPTSTFETAKGVDDFYVTSAEKTKLSNLSGTNTGDQDATDFDIKDLTDNTSLRSTWSGKQDALGFTPENVANKRTSFQATPTDTAYPSEKLTYDQLALKADLTTPTNTLYRQAIINGNFDVWQRGTSFNITDSLDIYTADRFRVVNLFGGKTFVASQITVTDLTGSNFAIQTSWSDVPDYQSRQVIFYSLDSETARKFAGQKIRVSCMAKSKQGMTYIKIAGFYNTTGSKILYTDTLITDSGTSQNINTSTWTRCSWTFTMPSLATLTATGTFGFSIAAFKDTNETTGDGIQITQIQLNLGETTLPFQPKSFAEELRDCQRYYQTRVVRTINGIMNYGLPVDLRATPGTATASAGTIANATTTGYQITHNANANSTIILSSEL